MAELDETLVFPGGKFKVYVDEREKLPRKRLEAHYRDYIEFKTLQHGDYVCSMGCCGFERKQKDFSLDKIHQIKTQLFELRQAFRNSYLVVNLDQKAWLCDERYTEKNGWLCRLAQLGFEPHWEPDYIRMFDWIYGVIKKNHDGKYVGDYTFSSIRHVKRSDVSKNILCSMPAIGPEMATRILDHFGSVGEFVRADPKDWLTVKGLGKKSVETILDSLWKGPDHDGEKKK